MKCPDIHVVSRFPCRHDTFEAPATQRLPSQKFCHPHRSTAIGDLVFRYTCPELPDRLILRPASIVGISQEH
jgi:hypothetical protein